MVVRYLPEISSDLTHHGIKGMKWGVRRYQNPDGSLTIDGYKHYGYKNLRKSRNSNLEKWGKDENHNILYIAGYSGSGKSTTAKSLAKKNDKIVHLDLYFENIQVDGGVEYSMIDGQDKDFVNFLNKNCPDWRKISTATRNGGNGSIKRLSKEYWNLIDRFDDTLEKFGKEQYKKGNKVIAEGVQIADNTLKASKDFYADKPLVILNTNPISSMQRAFDRDGRGNIIKGLNGLDSAKEYIKWYSETSKQLNELSTISQANKGKAWMAKKLIY